MRRMPWDLMLALLVGLGLGLAYSWVISPVRVTDAEPRALRGDFKDHYRSVIAAAYAANGDLPRAQARLALLADGDPVQALNAQAQRMLATGGSGASGQSFEQRDQLVALASALELGVAFEFTPTPIGEVTSTAAPTSTPTAIVDSPNDPLEDTQIPEPLETQPTLGTSTPRPSQTPIPTLGAPFELTGEETVCDPNHPDGLLQVIVFDSRRRQLAGAKIVITWEGGEEEFFTGLKPELGNGYADFIMEPGTTYTVQLGAGSDIASGLAASTCPGSDGEAYLGGVKLTFQQP